MNRIPLTEFPEYPILYPGQTIARFFNQQVESIWKSIHGNQKQEEELSRLRDTLLPKLLSGQLRIPEAEKQLAEVL